MSRPPDPRLAGLHALADDDPRWKRDPVEQARAACEGGARVVQLRAKLATDREALAWGESIREITREHDALFVVNDRFDLALALGADGVHLGQRDLPPERIPEAPRAALWIGRSTHTADDLERARSEPVDYLAFGPVFGTTSKRGAPAARGLDALRDAVRRAAPRPLIAIGGIDAEHVAAVRETGAAGCALISALAAADDPAAAVRELLRRWDKAASDG